MEWVGDLADRAGPAVVRVVDRLVAGQAPISSKHYPLGGHAGVHLLLRRHGFIQLESLYLAALQLGLNLFQHL